MFMYICVYICIYIYHVHVNAYMYMYMYIYIYTYIYKHTGTEHQGVKRKVRKSRRRTCRRNFTGAHKRSRNGQRISPHFSGVVTFCNILQHTATQCTTLQHSMTHCNTHTRLLQLRRTAYRIWSIILSFSNLNHWSRSLVFLYHVPLKRDLHLFWFLPNHIYSDLSREIQRFVYLSRDFFRIISIFTI